MQSPLRCTRLYRMWRVMNMQPKRVTKVTIATLLTDTGDEVLLAALTENGDPVAQVASDEVGRMKLMQFAQQTSIGSGKDVQLVEFTARRTVAAYGPRSRSMKS